MSYNEQVEQFVVGDLVYFTGYQLDNPPIAHQIGIVLEIGRGQRAYAEQDGGVRGGRGGRTRINGNSHIHNIHT